MRLIKVLLSLIATLGLIFVLTRPLGPISFPIGDFINPFDGFWQNAEGAQPYGSGQLKLPGLKAAVEVVYDERRVPHIFAENSHDAFMAQGFVTARDRLWQMEFQTHVAAGRLTEILPASLQEVALKLDRQMRRQGMVLGAENSLKTVQEDPEIYELMTAYSDGINAYIESLSYADLPLEYKLLNYTPEAWNPLKSSLLLKYMSNTLAGIGDDLSFTRAYNLFGRAVFDTLYPDRPYGLDPIIPLDVEFDTPANALPLTLPAGYQPDSLSLPDLSPPKADPNIGSNNWAISGDKSITGKPILAGDPHLSLNLPSIWYEIQIKSPEMNTYGVSLPGSPCVIIGYNDSIAWSETNAGRDVMDFYQITFKDDTKEEYLYNGAWQKIEKRVERFVFKHGGEFVDTVLYTELGPVMYDEHYGDSPEPLAVKWMAHLGSNEIKTFYHLNKANNYEDYVEALSHYVCPAQNFVFASHSGDIAIWQQGSFVNRWPEQGKFVLQANDSSHQWQSFIPTEQNPHVLNPPRGFVSSANQHPVGPDYPYYYHGPRQNFRNRRLNNLLSAKDSFGTDDMQAIQQDNFGLMASELLPTLLSDLDSASLSDKENIAFQSLRQWDYFYNYNTIAPSVFEAWWDTLYAKVWTDEFSSHPELDFPSRSNTAYWLMKAPNFRFFDDQTTTDRVEDRRALVNHTFRAAISMLYEFNADPAQWHWQHYKNTTINHLARISPSFGRQGLAIGGYKDILNACSTTSGPSWRMVVELGEKPKGYGVYPGGQTGNVGSGNFDSFIDDWAAGNYYELWRMDHPDDDSREVFFKQRLITK